MSFYWYLTLKESEFWELLSISFSLHKKAMVDLGVLFFEVFYAFEFEFIHP